MTPRKKSKHITKPVNATARNMSTSQSFWPRIEAAQILSLIDRDDMLDALGKIKNEHDQENTRYMMNYFITKCGGLSKYKDWREKMENKKLGIFT